MTNNQRAKLLKRGKILEFMNEDRSEIKKLIPKRGPKPKYVLKDGEVVKRRPGRPKKGDIFVGDDGVLYNSVPAKNPNIYRQSRFMEPIYFGNGIDKLDKLQQEERMAVIKELHSKKDNQLDRDKLFDEIEKRCKETEKQNCQKPKNNEKTTEADSVIQSRNKDEPVNPVEVVNNTEQNDSDIVALYEQADGVRQNTLLTTEIDTSTLFRNIHPYRKPTKEEFEKAKALYEEKGLNINMFGKLTFDQPEIFLSREDLICLGVWLRKHLRTYDAIFITQVKVGISHPEDPNLYDKLKNKINDVCMRKLTISDLREMIKHCEFIYNYTKSVYDDAPFINIDDARYKLLNPEVKLERDSRKELSNILLGILQKMVTDENNEETKTCKYYYNEQRKRPKIFRVFSKKKFKEF